MPNNPIDDIEKQLEEELQRHKAEQEKLRKEHERKIEDSAEKERLEREPYERKSSEELWQHLKAETDVSQTMRSATLEQQRNWLHQEQDPKHAHGNSYTASEQRESILEEFQNDRFQECEATVEHKDDILRDQQLAQDQQQEHAHTEKHSAGTQDKTHAQPQARESVQDKSVHDHLTSVAREAQQNLRQHEQAQEQTQNDNEQSNKHNRTR